MSNNMYDTDYGVLEKCVVCAPGYEASMIFPWISDDVPFAAGALAGDGIRKEHAVLASLIKKTGCVVYDFRDLLASGIQRLGESRFEEWLELNCSFACKETKTRGLGIDADALLGRKEEFFYQSHWEGRDKPLFMPQKDICYVRDIAAMTPSGMLFANFAQYSRMFQAKLARLAFCATTDLTGIEIAALDFEKEGVYFQGGDFIMLDAKTALVGVNNSTEFKAAKLIAQRLGMDVVAVDLPNADHKGGGSLAYHPFVQAVAHLDTLCTLAGKNTAVAVPYLLERDYAQDNPFIEFMNMAESIIGESFCYYPYKRDDFFKHDRLMCVELIKKTGWVTLISAGDAVVQEVDMKLVDYLKNRGLHVEFSSPHTGNLSDAVLAAAGMKNQAANIFAVSPGNIIVFEEAGLCAKRMMDLGVIVQAVPSAYLCRWNGGPHCLTLPLQRG